jgi:hypothetical protein
MRLRTTALVATAIAGLLYVSAPSASALPAASRADVTTSTTAKTAGVTEQVHYRRRGYRRYGYGYRPYGYYGGYPYYYRRRPGFGIYFGF